MIRTGEKDIYSQKYLLFRMVSHPKPRSEGIRRWVINIHPQSRLIELLLLLIKLMVEKFGLYNYN